MKARRQIVDPITGARVPIGSPVAVDTGQRVVGRDTVVPQDDLDPAADRFGIKPEAQAELREEIRAAAKRTKERAPVGRGPAVKTTMGTPAEGVRALESLNPHIFEAPEFGGVDTDVTREFLRTHEVRSGKKHVPIANTAAGKRILSGTSGSGKGSELVVKTLTYLLGKARGGKWRNVEWRDVGDLMSSVYGEMTDQPADDAMVYPIASGVYSREEMLERARDQLPADKAAKLARQINGEELTELAERLERAIDRVSKECLTAEAERAARERLRTVRKWARRPELAPDWSCVGSRESEGEICHFPQSSRTSVGSSPPARKTTTRSGRSSAPSGRVNPARTKAARE